MRAIGLAAMAACAVGAVLAGGCGEDDSERRSGKPHVPFHQKVIINRSGYHPQRVKVLVGGSITFVNRDPLGKPHTAQTEDGRYNNMPGSQDASFDTHTLSYGEPYTVTFHVPGKFVYFSSYDGWTGYIEVVDRPLPATARLGP